VDQNKTRAGIVELIGFALDAATSLEELVDCAHAAALVDDRNLVDSVVERIDQEVDKALISSGSWEAELTYNKVDAWAQTGHRARLLAEAWSAIAPVLAETAPRPIRKK
jgi:hypothetical protein